MQTKTTTYKILIILSLIFSQLYGTLLKGTVILRNYSLWPSEMYSAQQTKRNQATLTVLEQLPKDKSLCFWTARGLAGFLLDRSDVWLFPYNYDKTDFLAIQKNVIGQAFYELPGKPCSATMDCSITPKDAAHYKKLLVDSHNVYYEDADVLILRSKKPAYIFSPAFTENLYWK